MLSYTSSAILPGRRAPRTALNFHAHVAQSHANMYTWFQTSGAGFKTKHSMDTEKPIVTGDLLLISTTQKTKLQKQRAGFNHPQKALLPHSARIGKRDHFVWLLPKRRKTRNFLSHVDSGKRSHRLFATLVPVKEHSLEVSILAHIQATT